jgi:uncharacterized protein (DUF924 family)
MATKLPESWVSDVLKFWFVETTPDQWFKKDPAFDETVRRRFSDLNENLATISIDALLANAQTALAAVIVFDQMPRNMFRDTPRAYANDPKALAVAEEAIARGFDAGLGNDERMFLYLPFEHAEAPLAQARCVALMATLGDQDLVRWAQAHKRIIDRFGRFPQRNGVLGRHSSPEELEFLKEPDSSF